MIGKAAVGVETKREIILGVIEIYKADEVTRIVPRKPALQRPIHRQPQIVITGTSRVQ